MNVLTAREQFARARKAQAAWKSRDPAERAHVLTDLRKQIAINRALLVDAITTDTGKPALDALAGDILVTLEQMRFYERHASQLLAPRRVGRDLLFYSGCSFKEHLEPYGTVLIFGPANYPLQLCMVPSITALYAGNAVVLKVSERTPSVAHAIGDLVRGSALPRDLLQVISIGPEESGSLFDARPDFVFFTGSSVNGKAVAARAAAHGIPSLLELGGSDAALVLSDCNVVRTVEGIVYGAFSNAGQVCVGVKRLLVQQPLYERFLACLVDRTKRLRVGAGHDCDLGMLPTEAARDLFNAQVQDALERGAKLETDSNAAEGMPVILSNVPPQSRLLREESFGPVLCVQPFETEDEAIAIANASQFALGASVWTHDLKRAQRISRSLNAGNCSINDVVRNIANPHAGFGGNAASGYGRYHGPHGLYAFSRIKTIMENRSLKQREINWFPLTRKTYDRLNSLIELRYRPRGIISALRRVICIAIFAGFLGQAFAAQTQSAHLILRVLLPAKAHGEVGYLLFNSPKGFPGNRKDAVLHGFSKPVNHAHIEVIDLGKLHPGSYAASVYLDENDNGKLDTRWFGISKEPVGVSNNPARRMGPPHFKDCVFTMGTSTKTLTIKLVRP